jgi:ubiquinol-cytochrome c reductase cytochrome b subunit
MWRRLWSWINVRWPVSPLLRVLFTEEIPGGPSAFYSFGSSVLFVFILQAVTGICQLFFYVPTVDHAYASLSFFRTQVPFGWLIHNLHYWGATAMVVLVLLHMMRVFLWGAYKNPRELTWLLGVMLFLLTMIMMFTGSPLPWDEKGYWATEVGTSMAGTVPLLGDFTKRLLRGGELMGQLTISRFFILHVALLSGLLATFIGLHLVALRRNGSAGAWAEARRTRTGPFWPDQLSKDLTVACVVFLALIALAAFLPPAFAGPADPMDASFTPKPEWNFLFLYQSLKYFPGSLEAVGTVGVPLVLVLLLVSVPFIDRRKERNPFKRPVAVGIYFLILISAVVLSIAGNASNPGANAPVVPPPASSVATVAPTMTEKPAPGAEQPAAPPGGNPGALAPGIIGNVQHGGLLFEQYCQSCHGLAGKDNVPNPGSDDGKVPPLNPIDRALYDADPDNFIVNIDSFVQHGSTPPGSGPALKMPKFGDSNTLTQPQIAHLEAYVLSLSGVRRARILRPGISPAPFFGLVAAVFAITGLGVGGIRLRRKRQAKGGSAER